MMKDMKKVLFAAALVFAVLSGCKKDNTPEKEETPVVGDPFVMVYEDFIMPDDVIIESADTSTISVSKEYADKMGIDAFEGRAVTIWRTIGTVPFIRIIQKSEVKNERIILTTVKGEFSDMFENLDVTMESDLYINRNYEPSAVTRAGTDIEVTDVSGKYTDEDGVLHPAVIIVEPDSPLAKSYATKSGEEKTYFTAEELLADNLTFDIIDVNSEFKFDYKYPKDTTSKTGVHIKGVAGVDAKLSAFVNVKVSFMSLKKFEVGLKGGAELSTMIGLALVGESKKEWEHLITNFGKTTMVFWAGPFPIPFTFEASLKQKTEAKATATLEVLATGSYETNLETGCRYSGGSWEKLGKGRESDKGFEFNGINGEGSLEGKMGVFFNVGFYLGGSVGPELSFGPSISADAEVKMSVGGEETTVSASCGAYAGLGAELEAKVKILGYTLAKWETSFDIFKITLLETNLEWKYGKNGWEESKLEWINLLDSYSSEDDTKTHVPYRLPDMG